LLSQVKKAKRTSTEANIRAAKTAIEQYYEDTDVYPASLKDLVDRPADSRVSAKWKGPYMDKEMVNDPFKSEYQYSVNPKGSKPPYELYSYCPNKEGAPEEEWIQAKNL
jgi:general secretion pathway protein G